MSSVIFSRSVCVLMLLSCGSLAVAGVNSWTAGGPGGGFTRVVAPNPAQPSIVLAATDGGVFRSTDGGTTWTRATSTTSYMSNFTFDPGNANRVMSGFGTVLRSDDGGQTFAQLPVAQQPPESGASDARFSRDGAYLFVAMQSGKIYRTPDLGQNWTDITGPWIPGYPTLTVDPNNAGILYVAIPNGGGVYKSTNSGTSWTPTGAGPSNASFSAVQIAVKPGDSNRVAVACYDGVYVSSNGGTSWTHPYPYGSYSVTFRPDTPQVVVAVTYTGGVITSANSGDTFPGTGAALPNYYQLRNLQFDPVTPGKLWLASGDGPLLSTDAGMTFARSINGIRAESPLELSASDDGSIYAVFDYGPAGVFKRGTSGWQPVNNPNLFAGYASLFAYGPLMTAVGTAPQNGNIVYAISYNDMIFKSIDGGDNWTYAGNPLLNGNRNLHHIAIDPSNANVVYAGSWSEGIFKTIDGGQNWTRRATGLPNFINAIAIDRANTQVVYAATSWSSGTSVYKTTDGGMNWSQSGVLPNQSTIALAIDPSNSNVVYASLYDGVYKSTDGGAIWNRMDFGGAFLPGNAASRAIQVDAAQPNTLVSGMLTPGSGTLRSVNGGASWERIEWADGILKDAGSDTLIVDPSHPGRLIAGGHGLGILEYEIAPDLAVTLTAPSPVAVGSAFNAIATLRDLGPNSASPTQLRVTLPSWLTPTPPAGCSFAAPVVTCQVPAMRTTDDALQIAIPVQVGSQSASGAISAQLDTHESDPVTANNSASVNVSSIGKADLGVSIGAGTRDVAVNSAVSLALTVTNLGPNAAPNTRLSVTVPAGLSFTTATASTGTCTGTGTAAVTCALNSLAKDGSVSITLGGTANTVGNATVAVAVLSDSTDDVNGNNAASTIFIVSAAPPPTPTPTPTPTPVTPSRPSGGGGGGGSLDWLALMLLGGVLLRRGSKLREHQARR